jgi:hypothetical protein
MALVLVVAVLATAAVLGYALLSANTLQAEISCNLLQAASAEYVAESGVNVGNYYLQMPEAAPASWTNTAGYKLYATAVPLNDGTPSNFDLAVVANPQPNTYTLTSTGWPSVGSAFSHTATAKVTVNRVPIPAAGVFGGDLVIALGATFSSSGVSGAQAIQANGIISTTGGTIAGVLSAAPLPATAYVVPTVNTVNYYGVGSSGGTYLWTDNITLGTPQQITASTLTAANLPAQLPTNPAGIFYHQGALTISGDLAIAGTLIIRGGTLTVSGSVTLNPAAQFPALICDRDIVLKGTRHVVTANGVVFAGTGFSLTGNTKHSSFLINGALLMPAGAMLSTATGGSLIVNYSVANTNVPVLATFDEPATSVQINSWTQ